MKFTCYSPLCEYEVECNCNNACCSGHSIHHLTVEYIDDNTLKFNPKYMEVRYDSEDVHDLVIRHICPSCGLSQMEVY